MIADKAVKAVFLKGSIARGENDEFLDIDLYCLVKREKLDDFLNRRKNYLKEYRQLIFTRDVNHVGPQLVSVHRGRFFLHLINYTLMVMLMVIGGMYDNEKVYFKYSDIYPNFDFVTK